MTVAEALAIRGSGWDVGAPGAVTSRAEAVDRPVAGTLCLVDATAWIEFLRATESRIDRRLGELLVAEAPLAVSDLVLMKVLAGAADDEHAERLRRLLARCEHLAVEAPADYERAAGLYRRCNGAGVKVRRLPECVTAVVAMRHHAALLHADPDFDAIAACSPLTIMQ